MKWCKHGSFVLYLGHLVRLANASRFAGRAAKAHALSRRMSLACLVCPEQMSFTVSETSSAPASADVWLFVVKKKGFQVRQETLAMRASCYKVERFTSATRDIGHGRRSHGCLWGVCAGMVCRQLLRVLRAKVSCVVSRAAATV